MKKCCLYLVCVLTFGILTVEVLHAFVLVNFEMKKKTKAKKFVFKAVITMCNCEKDTLFPLHCLLISANMTDYDTLSLISIKL